MRMLLVKLSSLGDVVHALPAVTDAARAHVGLEVHWVVEEGYQVIPALHPAVTRVIPIAIRRWRHSVGDARAELGDCIRRLRASNYELVLDAQGLVKSSVVARFGRGPHIGFDRHSVRERLASCGYQRGVAVAKRQHAIDRQRALFAGALAYELPDTTIDYGIRRDRSDASGVVLAHGTTWDDKRWPEHFWVELANRVLDAGDQVTLPWGNSDERRRAQRIASLAPGADIAPQLDLRGVVELLAKSAAIVTVDSGIGHLAAALGVPTVALYGPTDAALTGCRGGLVVNLSSDFGCAPCLKRTCRYRGEAVSREGVPVEPACFSKITPERVWDPLCRFLGQT